MKDCSVVLNLENTEDKINDFLFAAEYNFKFDWNSL